MKQQEEKGYNTIIEDFIYLGPEYQLPEVLKDCPKVNYVVRCLVDPISPAFQAKLCRQPKEIFHLQIHENDDEKITQYFEPVWAFVEKIRQEGGAVYFHCAAGVNRSASICLSYLIRSQKMTVTNALHWLSQRRRVVCPDENFIRQLLLLEGEVFYTEKTEEKQDQEKQREEESKKEEEGKVVDQSEKMEAKSPAVPYFDFEKLRMSKMRAVVPFATDEQIIEALKKCKGDMNMAASVLFDLNSS